MIRQPVFLGRPSAWGLILMLAIVPAGYFTGAKSLQFEAQKHKFRQTTKAEYETEKFLSSWVVRAINYHAGFDCQTRRDSMLSLSPEIRTKFENDFWPPELRSQNPELNITFGSIKLGESDRIGKDKFKVRSYASIVSLDNKNAVTPLSINFTVDTSSSRHQIVAYDFCDADSKNALMTLLKEESKCTHSGLPKEAIQHFRNAAKLSFVGKPLNALEDLNKAIKIKPDFRNAILYKAHMSFFGGPENGINALTKAIEITPNKWSFYRARSSFKLDCGDIKSALIDLNLAAKNDSETTYTHVNRGYCLSQLGNLNDALKEYDQAMQMEPQNFNLYLFRGLAKDSCGDWLGARIEYEIGKFKSPLPTMLDKDGKPLLVPYASFSP